MKTEFLRLAAQRGFDFATWSYEGLVSNTQIDLWILQVTGA